MSLDWNVSKVAGNVAWETAKENDPGRGRKAGEEYLTPMAEALIWATLAVDLGKITEKNVGEWRFRLGVLAKLGTFLLTKFEGEGEQEKIVRFNPSADDVRAHVGLRTNVSTRSRASFMKKEAEILANQVERDLVEENRQKIEAETNAKVAASRQ